VAAILVAVVVAVILIASGSDGEPVAPTTIDGVEDKFEDLYRSGAVTAYSRLDEIELDDIASEMGYTGEICGGIVAKKGDLSVTVIDLGTEELAAQQLESLRATLSQSAVLERSGRLLIWGDGELVGLVRG
jgi:hypothetical protein